MTSQNYVGIIYFASPRTLFAGKVQEEDIIARHESPYRFIARSLTRSTYKSLDPAKCGYAVLKDGKTVEHVEAEPVAETA